MIKKVFTSLWIVLLLSFASCGGGSSSKEAKALLQKILQLVGIPQTIVVNVCQDSNRDGVCGDSELQAKVIINKGDSVDDIWAKVTKSDDGQYFLETYDETLPILLVIQDTDSSRYAESFTIPFSGFSSKKQNETKELSILQSMVDANAITKREVDKFRTLQNQYAQEQYYTTLLNDLETNINTLTEKGLDTKTATTASIKDMADETKDNQARADRINSCGSDRSCIDEEIKNVSNELIIDNNESQEIIKENGSNTDDSPQSTAPTFKSTLKKTGQTTSYEQFDDGYYQIGVTPPTYSRSGEIVTNNITGLQWQDDEDAKNIQKNWEDAKSYCSALSLGGYHNWRLPTINELENLVDYNKDDPALSSVFQNVSNYTGYLSSLISFGDSSDVWVVHFGNAGRNYVHNKSDLSNFRCVRDN